MKKRPRKRTMQGKRPAKILLSAVLALLLAGSGLKAAPMSKATESTTLQNPRVSEIQGGELDETSGLRSPKVKMRIRDTITFGSYWQEDTNGDGVADQNDDKQPIRWQVLSVDGNDVFLLADKVLDCQPYNTKYTSVTWETCSLRKWLNEDFYNTAFSEEEKANIKETNIANMNNPEYGTEGGADTEDKVYLLSLSEVSDPAYGFYGSMYYDDQARIGKATSYAEGKDVQMNGEKGSGWWLRSPGCNVYYGADVYTAHYAAYVISNGDAHSHGDFVNYSKYGVRPALHLNLSSFSPEETSIVETAMEESEWDMVELGTWQGQPMYWRVLSVEDEDAYLLADRILTDRVYHESYESVTWAKSTLHVWLNGEFYQNAFSAEEKTGIWNMTWENSDNLWYDTGGGADTTDSVSLLSLADIVKKEYGFPTAYWCVSKMRTAEDGKKKRSWWLRSPGFDTYNAADVNRDGSVDVDGDIVYDGSLGVRPVLHFNLSSSSLMKVGTATAKEDSQTGGTGGGVTYDPPGLSGEFNAEPEQPSNPSGDGNTRPEQPSTPSGGGSSGTPSNNQGQTENGGASGDSVTQGQSSTDSQDDKKKNTKPGKVTSLKAKNNRKKTVTLSWKKVRGAAKYQTQYSQNKKFRKAKKKTVKTTGCKITKLAKNKTWYFRVRAISAGVKKGTWSKTVKAKIKK